MALLRPIPAPHPDGVEAPGGPRRDSEAGGGPLRQLTAGEILVSRGQLAAVDLVASVADRIMWGSTLGEVLIGKGLVRPFDYYRALAEAYGCAFVNLHADPPDAELLDPADRAGYVELELIPWRREGGRVMIAAVEVGEPQREWAEKRYGAEGYGFVVTAPFDIFWFLQDRFRETDSLAAREALYVWKPEHSAKLTVTPVQRTGFLVAGAAYLIFLVLAPATCLVATMAAITLLYTFTFLFKFLLTWV
ncbi:MAG: hypothetical protein J0H63_12575, partial [Rhizobiales bacterium]|nr:hypothetical protein [Hyphomicrobiales bacterium]